MGFEKLKLSRSAKESKKSKQQDTKSAKNVSKSETKTAVSTEIINMSLGKSKRRR